MTLTLFWLPESLAIARLDDPALPVWAIQARGFLSITRTPHELSIVCEEAQLPADIRVERGWRAFGVQGPLDFGLTGILVSLARPLAEANISLFAVSTFDTDYVLVRAADKDRTRAALHAAGHSWLR